MRDALLGRICESDNLPSLPAAAIEFLQLAKRDSASVGELAAVIQKDPALTARLLKVVNSSLFGLTREVGSVPQAVALLGLRSVKVMALSFALVDTVRNLDENGFDFESYWRESLTRAVAARLSAKAVVPGLAEEAFVAGLLSGVGVVAAWQTARGEYEPVWRARGGGIPLRRIEQDRLGLTHAAMSRALLEKWGLPPLLCAAVGAAHDETAAARPGDESRLADVVASAVRMAELFCGEVPSRDLESVKRFCQSRLAITAEALEATLAGIDTQVKEVARMLTLTVGQTVDYARLQIEAAAALAELSVRAEIERADSQRQASAAREEAERLDRECRTVRQAASIDPLTQVANRAVFDAHLGRELERVRAQREPLGLIMLDVDHFKRFNDAYGHPTGDAALKAVGAALRRVVRDLGLVARYGGEEFAVVLSGAAAERLHELAEEIRAGVSESVVPSAAGDLRVTASVGAARFDAGAVPPAPVDVVTQADRALYRAKRSGRNRVECGGECRSPGRAGP